MKRPVLEEFRPRHVTTMPTAYEHGGARPQPQGGPPIRSSWSEFGNYDTRAAREE
jgi:hypothetical protein